MEITRRYLIERTTGLEGYLALQRALMRRFMAQGGSAEDFCGRLAPAFHRRFAPVFLAGGPPPVDDRAALDPDAPPLKRERARRAA